MKQRRKYHHTPRVAIYHFPVHGDTCLRIYNMRVKRPLNMMYIVMAEGWSVGR